jgi:hypothetical protein
MGLTISTELVRKKRPARQASGSNRLRQLTSVRFLVNEIQTQVKSWQRQFLHSPRSRSAGLPRSAKWEQTIVRIGVRDSTSPGMPKRDFFLKDPSIGNCESLEIQSTEGTRTPPRQRQGRVLRRGPFLQNRRAVGKALSGSSVSVSAQYLVFFRILQLRWTLSV